MPKEKIIRERKLIVTITDYEDGGTSVHNDNKGFSSIEIIGIAETLRMGSVMNLKFNNHTSCSEEEE